MKRLVLGLLSRVEWENLIIGWILLVVFIAATRSRRGAIRRGYHESTVSLLQPSLLSLDALLLRRLPRLHPTAPTALPFPLLLSIGIICYRGAGFLRSSTAEYSLDLGTEVDNLTNSLLAKEILAKTSKVLLLHVILFLRSSGAVCSDPTASSPLDMMNIGCVAMFAPVVLHGLAARPKWFPPRLIMFDYFTIAFGI